MKRLIIFIALFLPAITHATHNRAGEIVYEHISGYMYKVTIYTYTYSLSMADRDSLEIKWGDNTSEYLQRKSKTPLPDYYQKNVYVGYHTYPGPGTYELVMEDPNRNEGILNIPNSVNVVFALKTVLQINPQIGPNSAPVLLNKPIDRAAVGHVFVHNPAAYDPDGDSLSYKLTVCLADNGEPIEGYTNPPATDTFYVDPISGDLVWDSPPNIGKYNVAIEIEEWRNGIKISSIVRDMQIDVYDTDNKPPKIDEIPDICVTADSLIQFQVYAADPDSENVLLSATGGVFKLEESPAVFKDTTARGHVSQTFSWQTVANHVRKRPYTVIFRAEDDNPELKLVDYENTNIRVIAPPVTITKTEPSNSSVYLEWSKTNCEKAAGYKIYRTKYIDDFYPDKCQTGIPASSGYELIGTVTGIDNTSFLDNNNGLGLTLGFRYCYRVSVFFADGAESKISDRACTELKRGVPVFTNVTIDKTDPQNGQITIKWSKPKDLDTITIPPPYKYLLYFSRDLAGSYYTDPYEIYGLNDTVFVDKNIDTKNNGSIYKLALLNYDPENDDWNSVGDPSYASSVFISLTGLDRKVKINLEYNVPWQNDTFFVYRKKANDTNFDLVGAATSNTFTDHNLINGQEYCYYIVSKGFYSESFFNEPLINYSQIACVTPIDTIPPCKVPFVLQSNCDDMYNYLTWHLTDDECFEGTEYLNIYYSATSDGNMNLIGKITDLSDTIFIHHPETSMAGCYVITAVDSAGNESSFDNKTCIDICSYYDLPNVFTPNGDNENDLFHPLPYSFVEKVDMKIYNRWGNLVYKTDDPDINWDGKDMNTGKLVPDGVYYYVCEVYERRITGMEARNMTGFIHVYTQKTKNKP